MEIGIHFGSALTLCVLTSLHCPSQGHLLQGTSAKIGRDATSLCGKSCFQWVPPSKHEARPPRPRGDVCDSTSKTINNIQAHKWGDQHDPRKWSNSDFEVLGISKKLTAESSSGEKRWMCYLRWWIINHKLTGYSETWPALKCPRYMTGSVTWLRAWLLGSTW